MEEIIELLDKADHILRGKIKTSGYGSQTELKEARELIQKALTMLLDIH